MVTVIETNLSMSNETIVDHQSRVIEVESWDEYVHEIKECKTVIRQSIIGNLHGNTIPKQSRIENLVCDEFHLSCDIYNYKEMKSRKLAYLVDETEK